MYKYTIYVLQLRRFITDSFTDALESPETHHLNRP